jgi:predicted RNase H-like nuclease (RuvC/YqgF family)
LLVAGLASAQSLGELARQARTKRPKKTSSKVYTNDNIPRASAAVSIMGAGAAPPSSAAQGEGQQAAAAEGAAGEEGAEECDEGCWRGKFAEQRQKVQQAERELDILQREHNLARVQHYQDPNQAVREQYSANTAGGQELQDIQNRIQQKQQELQQFQQELSALEDDLRRAGGKPAWARE